MQRFRLALSCALLAALTGVAVQAVLLLHAATQATRALSGAVSAELRAVDRQISRVLDGDPDSGPPEGMMPLRSLVLARLDTLQAGVTTQVSALQTNANNQITGLRADLFDPEKGHVTALRTDTLARVDTALRAVEALRNDVKPAVDGAVALESDAKDSWDDMYWDVKALVGSATVAARGVAETSEAVGKAAPKLAESAVGIGTSTDAIAADVHTATSDFVKPKTFWQRTKAWLETAGKVGARFL